MLIAAERPTGLKSPAMPFFTGDSLWSSWLAGIARSTARRAAMIEKITGALLSQRLWSAASAHRCFL
jgi:hypothetical protein